jgi:hypothetical protein
MPGHVGRWGSAGCWRASRSVPFQLARNPPPRAFDDDAREDTSLGGFVLLGRVIIFRYTSSLPRPALGASHAISHSRVVFFPCILRHASAPWEISGSTPSVDLRLKAHLRRRRARMDRAHDSIRVCLKDNSAAACHEGDREGMGLGLSGSLKCMECQPSRRWEGGYKRFKGLRPW